MGIGDYLNSQFLEIIQWQDDSRHTISFRYPDTDKEIKRGAQLVVRESQLAQFVYLGQFGDTFGPGTWTLTTANIPILSTLKGWKYGFESPFKADIYFVNTRLFTGNKWGTANPIVMRDRDLGVVRAGAYGTFDFRVVDARCFLREVAGTDGHYSIDSFAETMRSRIVSVFSDTLTSAKLPIFEVASRYQELGAAILPLINQVVIPQYGLEILSFVIENVSLPDEVEKAIDSRSSMAAIGDLNDYVKLRMAEGMSRGDGAGLAVTAAQLGAGVTMGQQIAGGMAASGGRPLLSPADAAKVLGVSEGDVMTAIADGSLMGKRIGATWRITQEALDDFLKG